MLRKIFDYHLFLTEKGKPLEKIRPLISAADTFFYEAPVNTTRGPHIRDAIDIKRWMLIVVFALIPCTLMAIWNTGLQSFVYSSGDYHLMNEYLTGSTSLSGYFTFAFKNDRYLTILKEGFFAFFPIMIIAYAVGGLCEGIFACVRGHEISEGFLVTGILFALVLPPTIPYWMVAFGVAVGVILSKEIFGGSGMNIINPALTCRAFLFFTFPGRMSGDVWVGTNANTVRSSLLKMNQDANTTSLDGYSQATPLARFNVPAEIKKVHVDAIATNHLGKNVETIDTIEKQFTNWNVHGNHEANLGALTPEQMKHFITSPLSEGGLGLSSGYYEDAYHFSSLNYGIGHNSDWNLFFGDRIGSMGETSVLACILGAIFLIYTGVGSWRTMLGMTLGAFSCALLYQLGTNYLTPENGAWMPATLSMPAYKHLLLGGLSFGIVFMATDPVSSPSMNSAKWIYGALAGVVTLIIRGINPAYPEGVMLAILTANVFAPFIDYYAVRYYRRGRYVKSTT